jgi:ammonium transporter, Amt family
VYYLWGFAFCFGVHSAAPNNFIGDANFAIKDLNNNPQDYAYWFFQFTFCATAATIVSGACAERVKFGVYMVFSVFMTGWIYPIVVHSAWSQEGWLSPFNPGTTVSKVGPGFRGVYDFAGSGVVHMVGGFAALVSSKILGPRIGRFDEQGNPNGGFRGHSAYLTTLGTFILFFSWYSFNCGSTLKLTDGAYNVAARAAMSTTICPLVASLVTLTIGYHQSGDETKCFKLSHCLNGCIGGLVAITAGCALVQPWAAVIVGVLSGCVTYAGSYAMLHIFQVDDAVDAFTVHGLNGVLGVLVPGFFAAEEAVVAAYGLSAHVDNRDYAGVFMGGDGHQLGYQALFIVWVIGWTVSWTTIVFLALRHTVGLRVSAELERLGLDYSDYGGLGYDTTLTAQELQEVRDSLNEIEKHIARAGGCLPAAMQNRNLRAIAPHAAPTPQYHGSSPLSLAANPSSTQTCVPFNDGGARHRSQQADDWIHDEGTGLSWSESKKLFFDPPSGQFYDPATELWYDVERDRWHRIPA